MWEEEKKGSWLAVVVETKWLPRQPHWIVLYPFCTVRIPLG